MPSLPPIMFPIKGVNRTFGRSAQADGTAYDMLNVLPFDRSGRLRGGQRPGTVKQIADALADKIVLLEQVTTLVPSTDGTGFSDHFTYADGNLATVDGGKWTLFDSGLTLQVVSDRVRLSSGAGFGLSSASQGFNPDLPHDLTMSLVFNLPSDFLTFGTGHRVEMDVQVDDDGDRVRCQVLKSGTAALLSITDDFTGVTVNSGALTLSLGVDYTLSLAISGGTAATATIGGVTGGSVSTPTAVSASISFYEFTLVRDVDATSITVDDFAVVITNPTPSSPRSNNLFAVAGGNIYAGDLSTLPEATGGASTLDAKAIPQMAYSLGKAYLVDGTNLVQVDVTTKTVETYTATAGTAPTGCTLACVYRDRLILAAPASDPQNFFCSRVGDQHDWDYGQEDPAAAFAGNASVSGRIGEPITALIPASDDICYIGGDHDIWAMRGDPADGGSIDLISDAVGVLGPDSWVKAPDGSIYFVGSGGFYRLPHNGGQPVPVSQDKWAQFFTGIDRGITRITMAWDRDNYGCFIFFMPANGASAASVLWYDQRTDGFFPQAFPLTHGPFSSIVFDGDAANDRVLLIGSKDGYLRATSPTATTDDGTAITSYVLMGPYQIGDPIHDGLIEAVDVTYGDPAPGLTASDWGATVEVRGGKDAYSVTEGTPQHVYTRDFGRLFGRVPAIRRRIRGSWCSVKIGNVVSGKHWSLESVVLTSMTGGRTRR